MGNHVSSKVGKFFVLFFSGCFAVEAYRGWGSLVVSQLREYSCYVCGREKKGRGVVA